MYQGGSDSFLAPRGPIKMADEAWGIDMEGEVAVIVGDVPMGADIDTCREAIELVMLVNDVSLRGLIPAELARGSASSSPSRRLLFRRWRSHLTNWVTPGMAASSACRSMSTSMAKPSAAPMPGST
jgi:hypothetical protein